MPSGTDIEKRDRALVALALMTGARDDALASLRLRHVDLDAGLIQQDAREVRTKFSKSFPTFFVPVGDDIREIFEGWVRHLKEVLLWGPDDPLFPRTRVVSGADRRFEVNGLERAGWRTSAPIRAIFRKAFEAAGVPYFNPHSFRHALTRHGQTICVTLEDHKAFSQNLGHSSIKTTEMHYGEIPAQRQGQLIRSLGKRGTADADGTVSGARTSRKAGRRAEVRGGRRRRKPNSNRHPLDLVERHLVAAAIVELRRARRGVVRHRGGLFERAAVLKIGRDPGRAKRVVADLRLDAGRAARRRIIA